MCKKYKVGITVGVFDLFHIGHLNLLERCKSMCDFLIVCVCNDDYVRNIKHKEPVFPEYDRVRILEALRCVDKVMVVDSDETENKMLIYSKLQFDVLFSGDDWKNSDRYVQAECEFSKYGIRIEYLPYTKGISTTKIKEKI